MSYSGSCALSETQPELGCQLRVNRVTWAVGDYFRSSWNGHRQGRSPCLKGATTGTPHTSARSAKVPRLLRESMSNDARAVFEI